MSLADFSTCELSDALIKLSVPHGGHIPDIVNHTGAQKICSPAYTVQMVLTTDVNAPRLDSHFVDSALPGHVVVVNSPPEAKNAVWGGLMTAGAQARGATGVIISGRVRDLAEQRALGFPIYARGHSTLGQTPFTRPSAVNVPLTVVPQGPGAGIFPAVTIHPGDWMVADEDGVVCVPNDVVFQVVELASMGREVDSRCMEDIRAGKSVQQTFKFHRGK